MAVFILFFKSHGPKLTASVHKPRADVGVTSLNGYNREKAASAYTMPQLMPQHVLERDESRASFSRVERTGDGFVATADLTHKSTYAGQPDDGSLCIQEEFLLQR